MTLKRAAAAALALSGPVRSFTVTHERCLLAGLLGGSSSRHSCRIQPRRGAATALQRAGWAAPGTVRSKGRGIEQSRPRASRTLATMSAATPEVAMVHAAHVLVPDESLADTAMDRVVAGEAFAGVARELSTCPSKDQGGDLGWFKRGQMVPEFEAACFTNEAGAMVKVKTQFGWHVIAVLEQARAIAPMQVQELSEIVEAIRADPAQAGRYQLLDVREPHELELASIRQPAFINLPLSQSQEWAPKLAMGDESMGLDPTKDTIVLCHAGIRSMQVAEFLTSKAGFQRVFNVEGGINAYAYIDPSVGVY
eukprot:TRINITY_DN3318_c0_g1_i1.p1 TRINITY_DN3318_c0_g1~~TRINITY_DN3318_c0_g1_i1.p1  ORF type:complete len:323 (-),score=79.68 TRINITY_DN3318_c0_g1_i1:166-1092(-)